MLTESLSLLLLSMSSAQLSKGNLTRLNATRNNLGKPGRACVHLTKTSTPKQTVQSI